MEKGYIKLSRKFFENKIWQAARAFSEGEAWLDLIQSARFETSEITSRIGVHEITWSRGQYPASNRFLMKKWGRSEQWVRTFLSKLKKEKMITIDSRQGINVITLLNYDTYNSYENTQNSPNNSQSNSPKQLDTNELQGLVTHIVTQQLTQWSLTSNANNKKDKERKERKEYNNPLSPNGDIPLAGQLPIGEKSEIPELPSPEKKEKSSAKKERKTFIPPSVEQVASFCRENGYTVSPWKFVNYYTSNGWMVGKNKMKDWHAAVRTWQSKENEYGKLSAGNSKNPEKHIGDSARNDAANKRAERENLSSLAEAILRNTLPKDGG